MSGAGGLLPGWHRLDWAAARAICRLLALRIAVEQRIRPGPDEPCFYFGYGANLLPSRMAAVDPGAALIGPARLDDHRLRFSVPTEGLGQGFATVSPAPGRVVWGALYRTTAVAMRRLDVLERVPFGAYRQKRVSVFHGKERVDDVIVYRAGRERDGLMPSSAYIGRILAGAETLGLPADYVEHLRRVAHAERFAPDVEYRYIGWRPLPPYQPGACP